MDFSNLALFLSASLILIVTPGPDMIYVISHGIAKGPKAGVVSAAGVTVGILFHTVVAALGLGLVIAASAVAFNAIRYAGVLYLVYLGVKSIRDKSEFVFGRGETETAPRTWFIRGALSNILNPKIVIFFVAFLPQFADQGRGNVSLQLLSLGLAFASLGAIFLVAIGAFSGRIGRWLSKRSGVAKNVNKFTGGILILLGLRLAFVERR